MANEDEKNKELKEIELIVNDEEIDMISAMGWVEYPAINQDLTYFNDENVKHNYTFATADREKGIIVAPAMIPEKRIYRYNPFTNEEYYAWFSKETIEKLSQNFLISGFYRNNTLQHEHPLKGIHLIYSWLVANQHDPLITEYGYKNIPNGTWVLSYKIDNPKVKEKIKNGEINGLSVEAWITEKYDNHNLDDDEKVLEEIKNLLKISDVG